MKFMETERNIKNYIRNFHKNYQKIFLISFVIINIAFLFHTINFMFGDHDWNYVKKTIQWNEGTFEGRPLHFVLQSIFFNGHILPILNNLLSFFFLTLSGIFLAKYWKIPKTTLNYTLFTIFIATQPYTLAWLFYAKDTLINLGLPFIAIISLLISEYAINTKGYKYHLLSIILMYFSVASYAPIINFYGVCILGKILLIYIQENKSFLQIVKNKIPTILDLILTLILFKITLIISLSTTGYNTQTIPLDYMYQKLIETATVMIKQFITPLPFMEYKYKILLLLLYLYGLFILLLKPEAKKIPFTLITTIAILFASKLSFFIADERGEILAEMENFAYVPRLDFYGLVYVYALGLAMVLKFAQKRVYKIGIILAILITFLSCVRDMYAQKVWKLGFDAEMKVTERIMSKIEQHKDFYPSYHYNILQIGSLSLRKNFYQKTIDEETSLDLLSTSYIPEFMSRISYNFYYPYNVFKDNAGINNISQKGRDFLLHKAQPFPSDNFMYIDGKTIIIVLSEEGLHKAHQKINNVIPK